MKLATLDDGSRDGQLAVVSRDLKIAHIADAICPTLQAALDDWAFIAPQLAALYAQLNDGDTRRHFDFDPTRCLAPLPRAPSRASAQAYLHRLELERRAYGADLPPSLLEQPLMTPSAGVALGAHADVNLAHEEWGIDFGAGVAVILDDVPMGATADAAHGCIRLLMLANDITLRMLAIDEQDRGGGLLQAAPATGFSPVAVTPDELGDAWRGARLHGRIKSGINGNAFGQPDAGVDMAFNFAQLAAHLCQTHTLGAGTVLGAGPVSNKAPTRRGAAPPGAGCIAEQRSRETILDGEPATPYLRFGDTIRIEMLDEQGKSVFGAIEQTVKKA